MLAWDCAFVPKFRAQTGPFVNAIQNFSIGRSYLKRHVSYVLSTALSTFAPTRQTSLARIKRRVTVTEESLDE